MNISQIRDLDLAALTTAVFSVLPAADNAGLGAVFISAATSVAREVRARGTGRHAECALFDLGEMNGAQRRQLIVLCALCARELQQLGFPEAAEVFETAARDCAPADATDMH